MKAGVGQFKAHLIGRFALLRPDGTDAVPRGRRARALLAYLIVATPGPATRERLAALLWGDRGDDQARASLRQVLFELKDLAGQDGLLIVSRTDVRLNSTRLTTDLDEFTLAAKINDAAGLIGLFGEPPSSLLDDMDNISPAFDEWLAGQRERHREDRRTLALQTSETVLSRGNHRTAYSLARVVVLADPLDEVATVVAMQAAHAGGDVATTRRLFATLEQALRDDLGVAPSRTTIEAHDQLIRDAQPPMPVRQPTSQALAVVTSSAPDIAARPHLPATSRTLAYALLGAALCVALIGVAILRTMRSQGALNVVAVEPLTGARDDRAARALAAGFSTVLARDMVGTHTPVQIVDGTAAATGHPALVIGSSANTSGGEVHASVRLLSGQQQSVIWSSDFSRSVGEVDQMIEQVALQVARELHCAYGDGRAPIVAGDPETARLLLAACDAVGRDFDESARYSAQVVARAPQFARGWAEYAAATAMSAGNLPPRAHAAAAARVVYYAHRALALDKHQGLAYFAISSTQPGLSRWFERDSTVMQGLSVDRDSGELNAKRAKNLSEIGRLDDALGYVRHSFVVDHFLPGKLVQLADLEADLGDMDQANLMLAKGMVLWPHHPWFDNLAWQLAFHWGDPGEATRLLATRKGFDELPRRPMDSAFIAWRASPSKATSDQAAKAILDLARRNGASAELVQLLASIGHVDDAYALAERMQGPVDAGSSWFRDYLAPFRADPRFMTLAARLGLVSIWERTGLWPDFCSTEKLPYDCTVEAHRAEAAIGRAS